MLRIHPLVCAVVALACATPVSHAAVPAAAKAAADKAAAAPPKGARKGAPKVVEIPLPDATASQVEAAGMVYYGVYDCEFQQTVNIDKSAKHVAYVDVKSGKSQWLMKPVLSSTGAIRLEDVKGETLMVQISSKSMLLNVRTARRIVDDCISQRQRQLVEAAKVARAAELAAAKAAAEAPAGAASAPAAAAAASAPG